jgi:hypothetical protein
MDRRPRLDHELVLTTDRHYLIRRVSTRRVQREGFDRGLGRGGIVLHRAEQPFETLARRAGQDDIRRLGFLLGLRPLNLVDVQATLVHVLDDACPGKCHPGNVSKPVQHGVVRRQEYEPVCPMPRLVTVRPEMLRHRVSRLPRLLLQERLFGREYDEPKGPCCRTYRRRSVRYLRTAGCRRPARPSGRRTGRTSEGVPEERPCPERCRWRPRP